MVYTLRFFFSSKCSLFHNSNVFGSCFIHILYTGCAKIKKKSNSGPKRLRNIMNLDVIKQFVLLKIFIDSLIEMTTGWKIRCSNPFMGKRFF